MPSVLYNPTTTDLNHYPDTNQLPNLLYSCRWKNATSAKGVAAFIQFLTKAKIEQLYAEYKPAVSLFGRLLSGFSKVYATELQKLQLQTIAKYMAEVVNVQKEKLTDLSLLSHNLATLAPAAHKLLVGKIIADVDLPAQVQIPLSRGFLPFVKQIKRLATDTNNAQYHKIAAEITAAVFQLPVTEVLERYNIIELNRVLWELLQLDPEGLKNWIHTVESAVWLEKIKKEANKDAIFRLLWIFYHTDFYLSRALGNYVYKRRYEKSRIRPQAEDVPLLGFFLNVFRFPVKTLIPHTSDIAHHISRNAYTLSHIAFAVHFIEAGNPKLLNSFRNYLSQLSYVENPQFAWNNLVESYPIETSKPLLLKILGLFKLPYEPLSTFKLIERNLTNGDAYSATTPYEKAVSLCYNPDEPAPLFKNEEAVHTFMRLFYESKGWQLPQANEE
ncbi:MAG TPA: hypothetical protein PK239_11075 [Chitinophagales bacterium]|nr:hypothetical protein [Chitinophagales bacterium]